MSLISVVIPTLNEAQVLEETLKHLLALEGPLEIIVADGGSTDGTTGIVQRFPAIRCINAARGRGSQMNAGAALASGEWLLFLHADTRLPTNGLNSIRQLSVDPNVEAGGFRHRFNDDDWRLRLVSWLDNKRCNRSSIIYGDQALFVRRQVFAELGGFPDVDALEDILLSEQLVRRRPPVILELEVVTDARKFKALGIWRSLAHCALILTRYELGMPVTANEPFFRDIR